MALISSTDFVPRNLVIFTSQHQQLKPTTSHSVQSTVVSCINPKSNERVRVSSSAETRPNTHLLSFDVKETQFMKLIKKSFRAGKFDESLYFIESMVANGCKPDVVMCTKLIKKFFQERKSNKAVRVMEILEKCGEPDVFAYNALISGFCKANQIELANKVLDRLRSRGFSPDVVTYNIMIGSLCSRGMIESAFKVFDQLLRDNCKPTVITYTILIQATMLEGQTDKAMKLLDEMFARGLIPDMFTNNAIIRGMCKKGMVGQAFQFVRSLESRGCQPDVISYNMLLRTLLNMGKWEEGEKLMTEMISRGLEPNVVTYSILISSL